jgi:alkylation response protein AidB-like acyl-CoA dehydrogenase
MAGEMMTASLAGGLDGADRLTCVPDADTASHVLHVTADRVALVPAEQVSVTYRAGWDKSRRLFDVVLEGPGLILAQGDAARALADRIEALRLFCLAGDSLGGAEAALAMTVAYLETRQQFDRPLALFQALKHRVADMRTQLTAADALFWSRAQQVEIDIIALGALKALACTVYRLVAEEAIQLHGGIGLTMEHPCHMFLKRAMLNGALGGDADHWDERTGRAALEAAA